MVFCYLNLGLSALMFLAFLFSTIYMKVTVENLIKGHAMTAVERRALLRVALILGLVGGFFFLVANSAGAGAQ